MNITLNGDAFELDKGSKLIDLIAHLDLAGKRYAIEVNEEIIVRSEHETFAISTGDCVEVVQAIGGG
ncbi:MAG: sulfur carrier protein [Oleiphilaceae bacterium]|jgi:sulfur carrier protein